MPELENTKLNRGLTTLTIDPKIMDKMNEVNIESRVSWKISQLQLLFKRTTFYKHEAIKRAVSENLFETDYVYHQVKI